MYVLMPSTRYDVTRYDVLDDDDDDKCFTFFVFFMDRLCGQFCYHLVFQRFMSQLQANVSI